MFAREELRRGWGAPRTRSPKGKLTWEQHKGTTRNRRAMLLYLRFTTRRPLISHPPANTIAIASL